MVINKNKVFSSEILLKKTINILKENKKIQIIKIRENIN